MAGLLMVFGASEANQPARIPKGQPGAGRFAPDTRTHSEIRDLNAHVARAFQAHLVQTVQSMPLKRPNVSSGRLEIAMAHPRNRYAGQFGWGVGDTDYLDSSVAKYWRTIEEGSEATWRRGGMRGMEIYGQWGGSIAGYYTNRWGKVPQAGGPWGKLAVGGKLRALPHEWAQRKGIPPMIVEQEIEPHHYFREADETFHPQALWADEIDDILHNAFYRGLTVNAVPGRGRRRR